MRTAIFDALTGHAGLTAYVGERIYYEIADQSAAYPYIVFHKQSGVPRRALRGRPLEWELWVAKVVTRGAGNDDAEAIEDQLDLALTGAVGAACYRTSDIAYAEEKSGVTYRHLGGLYRIAYER